MKEKPWPVLCTAIVAIVVIELYALSQHVNGVMLATAIAAIAGIAGFKVRDIIKR